MGLDRLKLGLSEKPPEGRESVADLAEKIQALRATNTVEAAPERTGVRKAIRAERPVTARIRERRAAEPAVEAVAVEVKLEERPTAPSAKVIPLPVPKPDEDGDAPAGLPEAFSSRVTRRRQGNGEQLRLF